MMQAGSARPRRAARLLLGGLAVVALGAFAPSAQAQSPALPPATTGPAVGEPAPEFTLAGATRYGVLRDSVRLTHFRGKTVVLAFFFKARTKG